MKFLILFLLFCSVISEASLLDELTGKAEKKQSSRWTIEAWLAQKQKIKAMDLWLAMNTSVSYFESYLAAEQFQFSEDQDRDDLTKYKAGVFLTIFGLEGEYQKANNEELSRYNLALRIFGVADQSTNLTVFYGLQNRKPDGSSEIQNQFYGGRLSLYLVSFLGLRASYKDILEGEVSLVKYSGNEVEASLLIEIGFLQLSAGWFEITSLQDNGSSTESKDSGYKAGLRLYF